MIRIWKASALVIVACISSLALSQVARPGDQRVPALRIAKVRSVSMNTDSFSPQVDESVPPFLTRVENPMRGPWRGSPGIGSNMPIGRDQTYERIGGRGALFPGIGFTNWVPPDPTLAVGPNNIVSTVNVDIAFFSKTGTMTFQQSLATFFAPTGSGPETDLFDPKCMYDKINNRFIVVCLEQSGTTVSKFLFAVSDDSNPSGTWFMYRLEAAVNIAGNLYWVDYPGLGYNKDGYVLTGNLFRMVGSGFGGVEFVCIPKSSVLSGGAATTSYFLDNNAFGIQVAEMHGSTADRIYMASDFNTTNMKLHVFTNVTSVPPTLTATFLPIPAFAYPSINAPSPFGRALDPLDGRHFNVVWRGGKLLTTHTAGSGSANWVRWYETNTNNWPSVAPTLAQTGEILPPAGTHYFMGAICNNEFFDTSVIFTRSSPSIIADLMIVGRMVGDAPGTMGSPVLLESSLPDRYGGSGFNRWGDFFGIQTDPIDDTTFWGIGMTGAGTGNWWRTSIFSWTVTTPVVLNSVSASPNPVIGGVGTTGTVNMSGNAAPGGYVLNAQCSNNIVAQVPATVTVPAGASSVNFPITTSQVANDTIVTITASFRGINRMTNLTVQWASKVVDPTTLSVIGSQIAGNLNSLLAIDGDRLGIRVSTAFDIFPPLWCRLSTTSPITNPSKIEFTVVSRAIPSLKLQRIKLFDYVAGQFVLVNSTTILNTDGTVTAVVTTNPSRFVQPGTMQMRADITWEDTVGDTLLLWRSETDRAFWKVFR